LSAPNNIQNYPKALKKRAFFVAFPVLHFRKKYNYFLLLIYMLLFHKMEKQISFISSALFSAIGLLIFQASAFFAQYILIG